METKPTKKPMDPNKKAKLIYSGELFIFAILFLVLGILTLTNIWAMTLRRGTIFTWITIFGGPLGIGDFIWLLASKKRQAKNSWLDKCLILPAAIASTTLAIIAFVIGLEGIGTFYYQMGMGCLFTYLGAIYVFEGFYHYVHPIPGLLEESKPAESVKPSESDSNAPKQ
jgi:hypothetical protein